MLELWAYPAIRQKVIEVQLRTNLSSASEIQSFEEEGTWEIKYLLRWFLSPVMFEELS